MKIKRMVLDVIGEGIKEYGFVYDKQMSDNILYAFTREINTVKQMIYVQKYRFANGLFLRFTTNVPHAKLSDAADFIPREKRPRLDAGGKMIQEYIKTQRYLEVDEKQLGTGSYWSYNNEEEFKQILSEFVGIIITYGLDELKKLSIEEKVYPTVEMAGKLIQSSEELSRKFIVEHNINEEDGVRENILKGFEILLERIRETYQKPYETVQDMLVEVTAFLGEMLKKELGGAWVQNEILPSMVSLKGLNTYYRQEIIPLANIVWAWKIQNLERTKQEYLILIDGKLPVSEEQKRDLENRQMRTLRL